MFKFIIASNGHAVSNIPPFKTRNEAEDYIIANISEPWAYDATVAVLDTPIEIKPATCTCIDYAGDFDEAGQPSLECFGCDSGRLAPIDYVAMLSAKERELAEERREREIDVENAKRYLARVDEWQTKFADVREYIQASINRGEWEDELDEIFWHELADKLGLDLGLTEEIEITATVTYSGTVTVPKGTDVGYLELGNSWSLGVDLDGESVGEVSLDDTEIERSY